MTIDMNDMYIEDMDVFSKLDDAEVPAEVAAIDEANAGDDMDLFGEEGFGFDQIDESEEPAENEEAEEEIEEDAEEESEEETYEEELEDTEVLDEDGEEVDFEEYDVSLPDGTTVKLNEAIAGYRSAQQLAEEREAFEEEKAQFQVTNSDIRNKLELAKLEAQKVIEDYEDFDWQALVKEDPQAYVENREFLDRYKSRMKEITKEMESIREAEAEQEREQFKASANKANETLAKSIPGWNKDLYISLMQYGVELGMTEEYVTNLTDAGVFMALYKAKTLDNGKQVVKAKIKKLGGPKKVAKPTPKVSKSAANPKKTAIAKKLQNGNFDSQDLGDMFSMLED